MLMETELLTREYEGGAFDFQMLPGLMTLEFAEKRLALWR